MNPYLEAYNRSPKDFLNQYHQRTDLVTRYSWSIPDDEAIGIVAVLPDIVDMGAGTGYWASLITAAGGSIRCYDLFLGKDNHYQHRLQYHPIEARGVEILRTKNFQTLFLSWPPYDMDFGFQCIRSFRGKYLVYVGESEGGCTGNDKMFRLIDKKWNPIREIQLTQWEGIHDSLTIYARKE